LRVSPKLIAVKTIFILILLFKLSLNVKDGNSQAMKIFKGNLIAKLIKKRSNNLPFVTES